MAAPQSAILFVDDQSPDINYLCKSIKQHVLSAYYKDTWTSLDSPDCQNGWFQYTFNGTGVHVSAEFALPNQNYSVKIDNEPFTSMKGNGSYDSPVLQDGQHTITYASGSPNAMPALDFLAVTAGVSTPLQDKTIAVDDSDKSMVYSGKWSYSSPIPASFNYSATLHQNTAHWTSTVGDTLQFQFRGSSISVYGMVVYNATSPKNITTSYTIDGVTQTRTISNGTLSYLPMAELFHADLTAGDHTLLVNLTDIQGPRALGIDFITYNSSFASITPPQASQPQSGASTTPSWAPKVGIAIGTVAGVGVILAILLIFWQRYRLQRHKGRKYNKDTI